MAVRCKGGLEKIAKLEGNFENLKDDIDSYNQTIWKKDNLWSLKSN